MIARRKKHLGPTRLAAAWVIFGGALAGLALAAVFTPPPTPADEAVVVALPAVPDRYAAVGMANVAVSAPELNPEAAAKLTAPAAPMAPEPSANVPTLTLRPVEDAPTRLALAPVSAPLAVDDGDPNGEVVITLPGQREPPVRVGPAPPDPALMAGQAGAKRPAIAADGRTPFETYRRRDSRLPNAPSRNVALMVSGLGLDTALTEAALTRLPPEVTLSFAPYSRDLEAILQRATEKGHEVVIEIPMEQTGVTPAALGSAALRTSASADANAKRLDWILSRAPAYPMVTNFLGETYAADGEAMAQVFDALAEAGLAYLDDTGRTGGIAAAANVPYGRVDRVIPPGVEDVRTRISAATAGAGPSPTVVKVYAAGGGLDGVLDWVQSSERGNVTLVPASSAVSR